MEKCPSSDKCNTTGIFDDDYMVCRALSRIVKLAGFEVMQANRVTQRYGAVIEKDSNRKRACCGLPGWIST